MSTHTFLERAVVVLMTAAALTSGGVSFADEESQAAPVAAAEERVTESAKTRERNWRLRFFGAVTSGNSGPVVAVGDPYRGVAIGGGGGVGVNFEYRTSSRMGLEFGAMAVGGHVRVGAGRKSHRYDVGVEVDGYVPVIFALNFHLLDDSEIVDFYIGPLAATTFLSSVGVGPGVIVESRVDLGLGGNVGVDIGFGRNSRWSFSTGFKYISNVTNSGGRETRLDFDPLIFSFGFGFKF